MPARRAADSAYVISGLSAATRAAVLRSTVPGVPLRSTPGFMLSPATAGLALHQFVSDFVGAEDFAQDLKHAADVH